MFVGFRGFLRFRVYMPPPPPKSLLFRFSGLLGL